MTLTEAKDLLRFAKDSPESWQHGHEDDLVAAFRVFWASKPDEWEFEAHMKGAVLFARTLWIIGTTALA